MELIYLGIGLAVGLVIGVLIAMLRSKGATGDSSLAIKLASAEATLSGLKAQLETANRERVARDERDREENRLIKELAPVKDRLEQFKSSSKMQLIRTSNFARPRWRYHKLCHRIRFAAFGEKLNFENWLSWQGLSSMPILASRQLFLPKVVQDGPT
jgi:septal ring factor EnvC (AmiA/AmiB activator)